MVVTVNTCCCFSGLISPCPAICGCVILGWQRTRVVWTPFLLWVAIWVCYLLVWPFAKAEVSTWRCLLCLPPVHRDLHVHKTWPKCCCAHFRHCWSLTDPMWAQLSASASARKEQHLYLWEERAGGDVKQTREHKVQRQDYILHNKQSTPVVWPLWRPL